MIVVGKQILTEFCERHASARKPLAAWVAEAEANLWASTSDIKARYSTASFLEGNRVVFNIKGNDFRLEIRVAYNTHIVKILRVGTHAEYDKW